MSRSVTAAVALVACSLGTSSAAGQDGSGQGRRLTILVGPLFAAARDEHASPLRYQGAGPLMQLSYATRGERRAFALRLAGAIGTLRSDLTGADDLPRQTVIRGSIDIEHTRLLGDPRSRTHWILGAAFANRVTVIRHFPPGGSRSVVVYGLYATALGPLGAVERAIGAHAILSAGLSVPLLAVVARPYGGLYHDLSGIHVRVATVSAYRAADFTAAFSSGIRPGADLVLAYRLAVERYDDAQPFRFASQSVSLAIALRLGEPE